ncbi:hypothetical protein [Amycolatopsis sp. NPDC051128]|uniref:hypothetical protein n=1 Tax=Amycolatopsis sp. NPDC051128 TaxID=3155412 RepID=UPI003415FA19
MAKTGWPATPWSAQQWLRRLRPQADALHYTILAVDVEGFSAPGRTNLHRLVVRSALYQAVEDALAASGVRWRGCHRTDLGDGVLVLVPGTCPKAALGERVPRVLAKHLSAHNGAHRSEERFRLRVALHAGEITRDTHGFTGSAILHAFRLLESRAVRDALSASGGDVAVIASSWFYDEVIRHSPVTDPGSYVPVVVTVKETTAGAWIHLPARRAPVAVVAKGADREFG